MNHEQLFPARFRLRFTPVALFVVAALAAGCVSGPRSTSPEAGRGGNTLAGDRAAKKEIEEARRMLNEGDYSVVVPRLQHTISKYPHNPAAHEARYLLGKSYYHISSYRDAVDMFNEYLRVAPDGNRAEEARSFIARINDEYDQRFLSPERLDAQLRDILGELEHEPTDLSKRLELADVLWKRGDYDRAGRVYEEVLAQNPEFADDATVARRVEVQSNGELVLMTPSEIQRREVEDRPLAIVNLNSFRSGRDLLTREHRHYVVTGQAVNRSDSVLYGVKVYVTIYGFGNVVYDTSTQNIGRLNPGERRAFSVRFSNFENIENIHRHEAIGSFER